MASTLDWLDNLMKGISAHPGAETLMSAIPAAAGAFLLARPFQSQLGTPLGAILAGLGGVGAYQGIQGLNQQREDEKKKATATGFDKVLQQYTPEGQYGPAIGTPPPLPPIAPLADEFMKTGGMDLPTALSAARSVEPPPQKTAQGPIEWIKQPSGGVKLHRMVEGEVTDPNAVDAKGNPMGKPIVKPIKPPGSPFALWLSQHPGGTKEQYDREQENEAVRRAGRVQGARLSVTNSALAAKPFNQVSRSEVPFVRIPVKDASGKVIGTRSQMLDDSTPYGKVLSLKTAYTVPRPLVQSGLYARLQSIPMQGRQLIGDANRLLARTPGGPSALIKRYGGKAWSSPEYSAMQTTLTTMVDTVASAFSRRVSQTLIDQWKSSIAPNNASVASITSAVNDINRVANEQQQNMEGESFERVKQQEQGVSESMMAPDNYYEPAAAPTADTGDASDL